MFPDERDQVDASLVQWRQGDMVLGVDLPFVHVGDVDLPLTPAAESLAAAGEAGLQLLASEVVGLVVITQTCDLIRKCADRPFVELAPVVEVGPDAYAEISRGRRPRYVALGEHGGRRLAGDLDRTMTAEKAVLHSLTGGKVAPLATDAAAREFADALARKRNRAALPDDFVAWFTPVQLRVVERHNRQSDEGAFLRAVKELRVGAEPSWDADTVFLRFLFIFESATSIPAGADEQAQQLMARLQASGRFRDHEHRLFGLEELSAATYLKAERLDFDHLSV